MVWVVCNMDVGNMDCVRHRCKWYGLCMTSLYLCRRYELCNIGCRWYGMSMWDVGRWYRLCVKVLLVVWVACDLGF